MDCTIDPLLFAIIWFCGIAISLFGVNILVDWPLYESPFKRTKADFVFGVGFILAGLFFLALPWLPVC